MSETTHTIRLSTAQWLVVCIWAGLALAYGINTQNSQRRIADALERAHPVEVEKTK